MNYEKIGHCLGIAIPLVLFVVILFVYQSCRHSKPAETVAQTSSEDKSSAAKDGAGTDGPVQVEEPAAVEQVEPEPESDPEPAAILKMECYLPSGSRVWDGYITEGTKDGDRWTLENSNTKKKVIIDGSAVCIWEE